MHSNILPPKCSAYLGGRVIINNKLNVTSNGLLSICGWVRFSVLPSLSRVVFGFVVSIVLQVPNIVPSF